MKHWIVKAPQKLHHFLIDQLDMSSRQIKQHLDLGLCKVNDRIETFGTRKLHPKDEVVFKPCEIKLPKFEKTHILFEDDALLVYNKPPYLECSKTHLEKFFKQPVWLVHRLDKETTGVFILAKSKKAQEGLEEQFRERLVEKEYLALVEGAFEKTITVKNRLGVIKKGGIKRGIVKNGSLAITHFIPKKIGETTSLVTCIPVTGKTHQIRVHLSGLKHPVVGDVLYGSKILYPRYLLHCYQMTFEHPTTKERMQITQPTRFAIA
ncbi:MAG: Ribosomal large subunit pseudouridine synthase C [Chlamydiae bacterium]|nr:Ribosomal large subunit pseudouridine synthase C [Chlamydiota bacterium]